VWTSAAAAMSWVAGIVIATLGLVSFLSLCSGSFKFSKLKMGKSMVWCY
jgi:hypothetical protein